MTQKSRDFHEKLIFLEHAHVASMKLLGYAGSARKCLECIWTYFKFFKVDKKIAKISTFFHAWWRFSVVQLFGGCRAGACFLMQYACYRAGSVDPEGEGSTGPSRGEHRLTVYRAHASIFTKKMKISCDMQVRFRWEASEFKINVCSFRFWKREVEENSTAWEWPSSIFWKWAPFSRIVRSLDFFRCFCDPWVAVGVCGWEFVY